ncbi:MAG: hypothetical protein ABIB79_03575 [archaeon]
MISFKDFKETRLWNGYGPTPKVMAALYFFDAGEGLTKKEIANRLEGELKEDELVRGLAGGQETLEILSKEFASERKYYLDEKAKDAFENLHQHVSPPN